MSKQTLRDPMTSGEDLSVPEPSLATFHRTEIRWINKIPARASHTKSHCPKFERVKCRPLSPFLERKRRRITICSILGPCKVDNTHAIALSVLSRVSPNTSLGKFNAITPPTRIELGAVSH